MTQHVAVYPTEAATYRLLRGPLKAWLIAHSVPALWTPRLRGFQVREERMPDLLAMLEAEGFQIHLYERQAAR